MSMFIADSEDELPYIHMNRCSNFVLIICYRMISKTHLCTYWLNIHILSLAFHFLIKRWLRVRTVCLCAHWVYANGEMHTTKQTHMGIYYTYLFLFGANVDVGRKTGTWISCLSSFVMEKLQIKKIVHYRTILSVKILAKSKPVFGFVLIWLDAI